VGGVSKAPVGSSATDLVLWEIGSVRQLFQCVGRPQRGRESEARNSVWSRALDDPKRVYTAPSTRAYKKCAHRFVTIPIDEFLTSYMHHELGCTLPSVETEKRQRGPEDMAKYGALTEQQVESRAKVPGLRALVRTTSDGKKRIAFVNRDSNAAINTRRCTVMETRPPELIRSNFTGQPLKVDLPRDKLEPVVGGLSKKTGRRLHVSVPTSTLSASCTFVGLPVLSVVAEKHGPWMPFSSRFFRQLVRGVSYVPVVYVVHDLVGTIVPVTGASMQPTLNPGAAAGELPPGQVSGSQDVVLVSRLLRAVWNVRRGDIVVLRSPDAGPQKRLVKRVAALEGDRVYNHRTGKFVEVPPGHCWLVGDNRTVSRDSASHYGPVPLGLLEGRAVAVIWPPRRWQVLATSPSTGLWLDTRNSEGDQLPAKKQVLAKSATTK
jgi:inner membrane protease subunit 2